MDLERPNCSPSVGATADGSAGDADYGTIGPGYTRYRRPEPTFAAAIREALGEARTLVNVGAGAGSYEPDHLEVTAVEPTAHSTPPSPPSPCTSGGTSPAASRGCGA